MFKSFKTLYLSVFSIYSEKVYEDLAFIKIQRLPTNSNQLSTNKKNLSIQHHSSNKSEKFNLVSSNLSYFLSYSSNDYFKSLYH